MGQRKGQIQANGPTTYKLPPFFIPTLKVSYKQIYQQNGTLYAEGNFLYRNQAYLLGKVYLVLKNKEHQYVFATNSGLNGEFEARFDLSQVSAGEYAIYAAGGVVEGIDTHGKIKAGYVPTGYKIDVKH